MLESRSAIDFVRFWGPLVRRLASPMYVNNLSFDPAHPWFAVPGADGTEWALEVFTTENVYGLDADKTEFDGSRLEASGLQLLGGQRRAPGTVTVDVRLGDGRRRVLGN